MVEISNNYTKHQVLSHYTKKTHNLGYTEGFVGGGNTYRANPFKSYKDQLQIQDLKKTNQSSVIIVVSISFRAALIKFLIIFVSTQTSNSLDIVHITARK